MQRKHIPEFGTKYWTALILASIFGANTGDFLSDTMGLGHIAGFPFLAVLFALVIIAERFDPWEHVAYFWSAIVIIRTSATNIGDIGHDLRLYTPMVLAAFAIALLVTILVWQASAIGRNKADAGGSSPTMGADDEYPQIERPLPHSRTSASGIAGKKGEKSNVSP